jgi:hypothetical protein
MRISTFPLLRRKLARKDRWRRILLERLTEPIHLNLLSLGVLAFGSFRAKVAWDLVIRQQYAYGVLKAADLAREAGLSSISVVEVGVASGAGMMNMAQIARRASRATGVSIEIHGFDTGVGMPPAVDYRDHPDLYAQGDFPMDREGLDRVLPSEVTLHVGALSSTVPEFLDRLRADAPIGFIAFDVDYYSSTSEALDLLKGDARSYLPLTITYMDDIALEGHNAAAGARLAVDEYNRAMPMRRLEHHPFFEAQRIFKRAIWQKQIFFLHILDHPARSSPAAPARVRYIENPYLPGHQRPGASPERSSG